MSTENPSISAPFAGTTKLFDGKIEAAIQSYPNRVRLYLEYRRGITELSSCSDRVLKDLGINRGDIRRLVYEATYCPDR